MEAALLFFAVAFAAAVLLLVRLRRRDLGGPAERAAFETLHKASLAAPALRRGLTRTGAEKAARHLRELLDADDLAITDREEVLTGPRDGVMALAAHSLETGRARVVELPGGGAAVVVPLATGAGVAGTLVAFGGQASAGLVRATEEVGRWVATHLELAELDLSRELLVEAEVRALRAQISPHFIYNSLTTIASFVRTDPEQARELLLEFADFTRYSFRRHGEFTTLAEELRNIDRFLMLARARFGEERLRVTLRIAPEVLPVAVPFLCLQPLVENAVRHGIEGRPGPGRITLLAEDAGAECRLIVEDDGVGMAPEEMRKVLAGEGATGTGIGLANVDTRLRQVYGDAYGLVVETAEGAGVKITLRVPKYHPGVTAR
ncbi:two-component system LytT family sensor kinase [Actinocorallia herbida]|uniref:histidine kinase n=1 Tax=Actinocorallia herbida TaxID=58109 RepID=A0A3N1D5U7_9ACTN|nr:histidine kinase [Actinocorallia herbida]ROO88880.1 two-component system LytT family sensor kinase [Actinocorallia herbida]